MATTKRKQTNSTRKAQLMPPDIARVLAPSLEPVTGPILNNKNADIFIDSIMKNAEPDKPEALAHLLCFLGEYQTDPYVIDAFGLLVSAAYIRSRTFYDDRAKFIDSIEPKLANHNL